MTQDIRVAHLIAPGAGGGGGAEAVVATMARHRAGPTLVVGIDRGTDFHQRLLSLGVDSVHVRSGRNYREQAREVVRILRDFRADVTHPHVYHGDFAALWARRQLGIPAVSTFHGYTKGILRNRLYEWIDRRVLPRLDGVICVSAENRRRLIAFGCPPDRLHVVHNGVITPELLGRGAARSELGLPAEGRVIGWIGRLSMEKGPDLLLEALEQVDDPDVTVAMIGDGRDRPAFEQMLAASRWSGRVRLLGYVADAARYLRAFDLVALSSRTEGHPIVLLEAMAAAVPIASFAVGGVPEFLSDRNAFIVADGRSDLLGRAIAECLADPDEAGRRAGEARALAESRYSVERWLNDVEDVYRGVLGR